MFTGKIMENKILYICSDFYPMSTGYSNAFKNFLDALGDDYYIDILTTTPNAELKTERINRKIFKSKKTSSYGMLSYVINSLALFKEYKKMTKACSYDFIFIETFDDALFLSLISEKDYKNILVRVHSTSETEYTYYFPGKKYILNKFLQKKIISKKIKNICSTNSFHNEFMKREMFGSNLYHISKKNFFVIPNTMPGLSVHCENKNENKKKIFFLGRLNNEGFCQKGVGDLLNAILLLGERFYNHASCTIVGDGDYYDYCNNIIKKHRLETCVKLVRQMPHNEIIKELTLSDIVVLPSRFEGMSMFALEALYTQNMCLFSDTGGLSDMIPNREFTYPPQNIEALAAVIDKAVNLNPANLEQEKTRAHQKALTFSNDKIKNKFDKIFKILASN